MFSMLKSSFNNRLWFLIQRVKPAFTFFLILGSPGRLTVRFLTTIPSAAENSMQMEDDQPSAILVSPTKENEGPLYAILHTAPVVTPTRRQSIVTLHPTETMNGFSTNLSSQNNNHTAEPGPSS